MYHFLSSYTQQRSQAPLQVTEQWEPVFDACREKGMREEQMRLTLCNVAHDNLPEVETVL